MYLEHFGLKQPPFRLAPDPRYLYLSRRHQLALNLLRYGLSDAGGGITVMTGHVGAGKTTLLRQVLREIDENKFRIGLLNNTLDFDEHLIRWIASAFDIPFEGRESIALFRAFQKFVIDEYAHGRQVILIVDEAQNLSDNALEEIRLLSNINSDDDQLLKIILVGQPELREQLSQPKLSQIAQRVSVEYHLEPLTRNELSDYVRHRLAVSGRTDPLFEEDALDALFNASAGVPRLINTLSDQALVHAFADDRQSIDRSLIEAVVRGRRLLASARAAAKPISNSEPNRTDGKVTNLEAL
jgi:type II secretory pathway predicted ATPase ExeA